MVKLLYKYRFILAFLCIPYCFILYLLITPTNYEVDLPGDIRPVENQILIDSNNVQTGSFNTTFVMTYKNMTIFQKLVCDNYYQANVLEINPDYNYITNEWAYLQGLVAKESSIYASIITAYEAAKKVDDSISIDYDVLGMYIYDITKGHSGSNELKVGDVVKGSSNEECINNVTKYINGDTEFLDIYRKKNGQYEIYKAKPTINSDGKLGISLYWYCYQINSIYPDYTIKSTNIGGNSGGLMQTLSVFNYLTEKDYSFGMTIAGTGAIDVSGNVLPIGAIEQKIYTAYQNKIDIFFVPESQYQEALVAYKKLHNPKFKLLCVDTFDRALSYLIGCDSDE